MYIYTYLNVLFLFCFFNLFLYCRPTDAWTVAKATGLIIHCQLLLLNCYLNLKTKKSFMRRLSLNGML